MRVSQFVKISLKIIISLLFVFVLMCVYDFFVIRQSIGSDKEYFSFSSTLKNFRQQRYLNGLVDCKIECDRCGQTKLKIRRRQVNSYIKINSSILYCYDNSLSYKTVICQELKEIDAESFKISGNYLQDKNGIYYLLTGNDKKIVKLNNVDLSSFKVLNAIYAKDKNTVYCKGTVLKEADSATFYLRDYGGVYYRGADKNNKYLHCDIYKE